MFSPQSSAHVSNQASSRNTAFAHSTIILAQNVLGSLHLVRQLFAYYANWRSASRVFDEELDLTMDKATLSSEKIFEKSFEKVSDSQK